MEDYESQTDHEFTSKDEISRAHTKFDFDELYMNRNALDQYPEIDLFQEHLTLNGLRQFMQVPTKNAGQLTKMLLKRSGKQTAQIQHLYQKPQPKEYSAQKLRQRQRRRKIVQESR